MIDFNSTDFEKWEYFNYCITNQIPVRGKIIKYNERFGFTVNIYGIHAELDKRELSYGYVEDFEMYVDKSFLFKIIASIRSSNRLKVSRKRLADTYKQHDVVEGIVTKIMQNRLDVDCGRCVRVHIRNIADRFISDINKYYQVGQQVDCMLLDNYCNDATMKPSDIWGNKVNGINTNDVLKVHFFEQKEKGIAVKYSGLSLYIAYNFLTPEYKILFDEKKIPENDIITAAVSKIDYNEHKIFLSMVLANKIAKREEQRLANLKRQKALDELKKNLDLGYIVEAIVKKVSRKDAIIQISGTDIECTIKREDLSPNKIINAEDQVFVGERIHVVYVGERDGELIFKRNIIMQDIYDSNLYEMPQVELLSKMDIHSSKFIGKVTKIGSDLFFTNIMTKDDNPLENGKLLVDPQIGRCVYVLIPSDISVEEDMYYEFELKLAAKKIRQKEGSPFVFSMSGKFKKNSNPYKNLVSLSFKQHTSPNTNTSVANLLEEVGQNLYTSKKRMFFELLQNADDAAPTEGVKVKIQIIGQYFVVTHDGFAFNQHDFESITSAAKSTKRSSSKKTGYKGIGFKSVFTNSQSVLIKSMGFKFAFDKSLETYNDFEKFYFLVNDIEDNPEKQEEFLYKYNKYYREFQGVKDVPWQLLPIWHDDLTIEPKDSIFNRDENVAIALKMDEATLSEYEVAVREVFSQPRFMLFLRNTNRVQLLVEGKPLTIQKNKDEEHGIISLVNSFSEEDKLSEDYRIISVDNIAVNDDAFSNAGVLMKREERINNRGEKENYFIRIDEYGNTINEIFGVPDRIASTDDTAISFAIQLDENGRIIPSETGESSLYAYLPMNEHRFKFPFYINADFIPKSDREGIQSDNPWNHFLFYTIGKNIVKMVAKLASSSEPKYLDLLLPSVFESNSQDTAALIDSFNRGYTSALHQEPLIVNDDERLVPITEIVLDESGLADEMSSASFYKLLETNKHQPHYALNRTILKNEIFNIEKLSVSAVVNKLTTNLNSLNNWIESATAEERRKFYEWIKANNDASSLINLIKIVTFGGVWKSITEINSDANYIILAENTEPLKDVLTKLGFICSDDIIENHPLAEQIELISDKQLFEEINNRGFQSLSFTDRLLLFKQASKFYGIGDETLREWELFKNQNGDFMPLSKLCAYSADIPTWLNKYILSKQENSEKLNTYLIPTLNIYSSIIESNIDELITHTNISDIYSSYNKQWSSQLTTQLFGKITNEEILYVVEQSNDETKVAFIKTIQSLPLISSKDYPVSSFEYRIIKLSTTSTESIEHIRKHITIDGENLTEYTIQDEISIMIDNRKIPFLLSKILPDYSTSSVLSITSANFSSIQKYDKIFEQREASTVEIRNKLYHYLISTTEPITAYQYCFLMTYRRSQGYSSFDNTLRNCIRANNEQIFIKILELSMDMNLVDILKNFITNGGISYPFTKLIGTYFDSDEYTLIDERIPTFIKKWATNSDKKRFLVELGLHDEQSNEIIRRKSFTEKKYENIWNITDTTVIRAFLKWVIHKFDLPLVDESQVTIIKNLCKNLRNNPRLFEIYDESDMSSSTEWTNPRYLEWKKNSELRIFVIDNLLPYRGEYNGVCLFKGHEGILTYFSGSKKIYISNTKEPASVLADAYENRNIPFYQNDWNQIFLISVDDVNRQLAEKDKLIEEYLREIEELKRIKTSGGITKGSPDGLSKAEAIEAQIEAQEFFIKEMPNWEFPVGYGECDENGQPNHFSTISVKDESGEIFKVVLKSYKKQNEPFMMNPEELDHILKRGARLFIYDGTQILELDDIKEVIKNQPKVTITFSTKNLDAEKGINAFAESLHFFNDLHFDFESFNVSKKAKSIRAIYNKREDKQPQLTDDAL